MVRESKARAGPAADAVDVEAARGSAGVDPPSADLAVSVVGRLFRLAPRMMDLLELGAREYGLGFARGRVLWALRESGPVLMRALSDALGVSPRTVTGLVDALEADGWVTRRPHPTDRRATIIDITPAAEAALSRLDEGYRELAHHLLADVPPGELDRFRAMIGRLEERLDDAVARALATFGGKPPRPPDGDERPDT
jgi:DNA-binding MarR family transcriptional regulator